MILGSASSKSRWWFVSWFSVLGGPTAHTCAHGFTDICYPGRVAGAQSGADAMTDEPRQTTPRPILSSISAQLFVANIKSSCDFYTNKLGFAVEFIYGDPPYYGQVIRDNARLALRLVFEPVFVGDVRKREHLLSASITVDTANEIKQLFLSYQARGVSFRSEEHTSELQSPMYLVCRLL